MKQRIKFFFCYACKKRISLQEIQNIDFELSKIDQEDLEFIYDQLPAIPPNVSSEFYHIDQDGRKVLNLCQNCYKIAFNRYYE